MEINNIRHIVEKITVLPFTLIQQFKLFTLMEKENKNYRSAENHENDSTDNKCPPKINHYFTNKMPIEYIILTTISCDQRTFIIRMASLYCKVANSFTNK